MSDESLSTFLSFRLSGQSRYASGEPVILRFSVSNGSDRTVWLLSWLSPLEGLRGDILTVVCDGKVLPYEGIMMKRGDPAKADYIEIGPNGTAFKDFDLSLSYTLSPSRDCKVEFSGHFLDACLIEGNVPRKREQFKPFNIDGDGLVFEIL